MQNADWRRSLVSRSSVLDYSEHALTSGSGAQAASYIHLMDREDRQGDLRCRHQLQHHKSILPWYLQCSEQTVLLIKKPLTVSDMRNHMRNCQWLLLYHRKLRPMTQRRSAGMRILSLWITLARRSVRESDYCQEELPELPDGGRTSWC